MYIDLNLKSVDTESMALGDYEFLVLQSSDQGGSHVVGIHL